MNVRVYRFIFWTVLVSGFSLTGYSAEAEREEVSDGWGLHNGCISNMRISRVQFDSRDSGVIELNNGSKLRITLRNGCSGIRTEGYVHKPINHQFCEGDILRVLNYGNACIVDKLEPLAEESASQAVHTVTGY